MYLWYGVGFLCATAVLFAVTLLGARNPVRPGWAGESIVANILTPLILGLLVLGIAFCAKAFTAESLPGYLEWGYAAATLAATVALVGMLRVRQKLAAFSAEENSKAEIIHVDFPASQPPENPIPDKPDYRRAA